MRAALRTWLGKLLLMAGSFAIALALAEVLVRTLPETTLGFSYREDRFQLPTEYHFQRSTNRRGFHDTEHRPPQPDERRVILLGDSYVEGYSVRVPETVGQRVQHYLNARSSKRYQVISLGKAGWGPPEEMQALKRYGPTIKPHVVMSLFLSLNDVQECSPTLRRAVTKQRGAQAFEFRPGWWKRSADSMPIFILRWSVLNQLISHRLALRRRSDSPKSIPVDYFVYAQGTRPAWEAAWAELEQLFVATRDETTRLGAVYAIASASTPQGVWGAEAGVQLLFETYPAMRRFKWDLDQPDRRLSQICRRNGIPFLALEPLFRVEKTQRGRRLHWRYDGHWNAEGNDLAARYLSDLVIQLEGQRGAAASR